MLSARSPLAIATEEPRRVRATIAISSFAFVILGTGLAEAQRAAPSFTTAQAARGEAIYLENCVTCHGSDLNGGEDSPPLTGTSFQDKWRTVPLGALYNYINTQMPLGRPGEQGAGGSADVLAYILSMNKVPAGAAELPPDAQALNKMALPNNNN